MGVGDVSGIASPFFIQPTDDYITLGSRLEMRGT